MRDATRGGLATVLNELVTDKKIGVELMEDEIPVRPAVRGACELLGLDPLHIANEGQFVAIVSECKAQEALAALQKTPGGEESKIIGSIITKHTGRVIGKSSYGSRRVIDVLVGDPLPRIC